MSRHLTCVGMILLLSPALCAEESEVYNLGEAGLTKAALAPTLVLCDGTNPCTTEATTAITLATVSGATTLYRWEDLPDVAAGTSTSRALTWQHDGVVYTYSWPQETRTPQSLIAAVAHQVSTSPLRMGVGATFPPIGTTVHGLTSDPTGATATFTMWSRGVPVLNAVSATCPDVDARTDGTWSLTCEHQWTALETADPCLDCKARFRITLPSGDILPSPPDPNQLRVVIFE